MQSFPSVYSENLYFIGTSIAGLEQSHTMANWCLVPMYLTHLPLDKMIAFVAEDIFRRIFVNKNFCIFTKNSSKVVLKVPIDNKLALV